MRGSGGARGGPGGGRGHLACLLIVGDSFSLDIGFLAEKIINNSINTKRGYRKKKKQVQNSETHQTAKLKILNIKRDKHRKKVRNKGNGDK